MDGLEKPLVVDTSPPFSRTLRRRVWLAIARVLQSIATIVKGVDATTVSACDLGGTSLTDSLASVHAMTTTTPNVGFAGLGRMGRPMARQLIDAGFPVSVYNRTSSVADAFAAESGATAVASSRSLGERCSLVVTMLSDGPALLDLLGGDDGLVAGLSAGDIVIDMGTTGVEHTNAARRQLADVGAHLVEAPVSGSVAAAQARKLLVMAAGERATAGERDARAARHHRPGDRGRRTEEPGRR